MKQEIQTDTVSRRRVRARAVAQAGSLQQAVLTGLIEQFEDLTMNEVLVLGLINQEVRTFIGIFGHGSTDLGEVLRVYEEEGLLKVIPVHNEVMASHVASMLAWKHGERPAVFTSIGPGALQAAAGSLVSLSNGLGVYYLFGDETTHNEGPNMQQIPRKEQDLYLRLLSTLGKAYSVAEPQSIYTALKWGYAAVNDPAGHTPFFLLLPMNAQSTVMEGSNLLEIPAPKPASPQVSCDERLFKDAVRAISTHDRILVKIGGGARDVPEALLSEFVEATGAVLVHGPNVSGRLPYAHERNMGVGGSKGSICGNYAMEHCDLLISIGARGVCQADSSGTAWKAVRQVVSINTECIDAYQYNRTIPLLGDAALVIGKLLEQLGKVPVSGEKQAWLEACSARKELWDQYKQERYDHPVLFDEAFGREVLTQPAAIRCAVSFADAIEACKVFDAGDVQANGFQIVEDSCYGKTITDTGSSYMGFAASAIFAHALVDTEEYAIAFTGDGSFLMNPQILSDAVQYGLKAMVIIFDNRRMGAISSLQKAQYGIDYATNDSVAVDYVQLASSFAGVKGSFGGYDTQTLKQALVEGYEYNGLSVIHVPVYFGDDPKGGLGTFGSWNVGCWCDAVQQEKHRIGL